MWTQSSTLPTDSEFSLIPIPWERPGAFGEDMQFNIYKIKKQYEKSEVEVKLSLCLTKHHAMKTYWGVEV
jgi:hypothetical protein